MRGLEETVPESERREPSAVWSEMMASLRDRPETGFDAPGQPTANPRTAKGRENPRRWPP